MKVLTQSPVLIFHSFNVSIDPLTTYYPSLEKLTEDTIPLCPSKVLIHYPV
jgi:hypothetical protein